MNKRIINPSIAILTCLLNACSGKSQSSTSTEEVKPAESAIINPEDAANEFLASKDFTEGKKEGVIWDTEIGYMRLDTDVASKYPGTETAFGIFTSPVKKLSDESTHAWEELVWKTSLPFGKALPDWPNGSETEARYPQVRPSLLKDIVGLWHLRAKNAGLNTGNFNDRAGFQMDGVPSDASVVSGTSVFGGPADSQAPLSLTLKGGAGVVPYRASAHFQSTGSVSVSARNPTALATGPMTVMAWVNLASINSIQNIVGQANPQRGCDGYALDVVNGRPSFIVAKDGVAFSAVGSVPVVGDHWVHLVGVYADQQLVLYVNGQKAGAMQMPETPSFSSTPLIIGNRSSCASLPAVSSSSEDTEGSIQEVALWKRPLDDSEVLQLYRRGINRVEIRVRTCTQADCSDNPPWLGPNGTSHTAFDEQNNFYYVSNHSARPWVMPRFYVISTSSQSPQIYFSDYQALYASMATSPQSPRSPWQNPYMQYQVTFESKDSLQKLCRYRGKPSWCSPELQSVSVNSVLSSLQPRPAAIVPGEVFPRGTVTAAASVSNGVNRALVMQGDWPCLYIPFYAGCFGDLYNFHQYMTLTTEGQLQVGLYCWSADPQDPLKWNREMTPIWSSDPRPDIAAFLLDGPNGPGLYHKDGTLAVGNLPGATIRNNPSSCNMFPNRPE